MGNGAVLLQKKSDIKFHTVVSPHLTTKESSDNRPAEVSALQTHGFKIPKSKNDMWGQHQTIPVMARISRQRWVSNMSLSAFDPREVDKAPNVESLGPIVI